MLTKAELGTAALICLVAAAVSPRAGSTVLVPVGLLAGVAAVGSPNYAVALMRGARAGALGGLFFVTLAGFLVALQYVPIIGVPYAVDVFLFTGFAMMVMLVPLYGIAGMVVAPIVRWFGDEVANATPTAR